MITGSRIVSGLLLVGLFLSGLAALTLAGIRPSSASLSSKLHAAPNSGHPDTRAILGRIREREAHIYTNYAGVAGLRHSHIRIYRGTAKHDPAAMLSEIRISAERRDYYDAMPEVRVTRYTKDGAQMPPEQFEYNEFMPPHPLFGKGSRQHYAMQLRPTPVSIEGVDCYRLDVQPLARTKRHFTGSLFFRTDDLSLRYVRGSYAKLRIGLQSFHFEFHFTASPQGVPLFTKGYAEGRVYFPLLRDETIVSDMSIEQARPLQRR